MNTTDLGRLGEIKVAARLVELGWYVFTDISGKCPVDLIAWKDGIHISFQVKSTNSKSPLGYTVGVSKSRPNRTRNSNIHFNKDEADYLAVYILPLDTVCFLRSKDVEVVRSLTFGDKAVNLSNGKILLISEFSELKHGV